MGSNFDKPNEQIILQKQIMRSSVDDFLEEHGVFILEDETEYPGVTLHVKKLVLSIPSYNYNGKEYEIIINSGGGDLTTFLSLYDAIIAQRKKGINISTTVCGVAASGAALVLQAGRVRSATENSYIMIHDISIEFEGKLAEAEIENKVNKKFRNTAYKIWAQSMDLSIKELTELIERNDLYYSAQQAKRTGLIDVVV